MTFWQKLFHKHNFNLCRANNAPATAKSFPAIFECECGKARIMQEVTHKGQSTANYYYDLVDPSYGK